MKLLAVGDSFTWGEELADQNQSWPHQLGQILGNWSVINLGKKGSGNTGILRRAMQNVDAADLIVIGWSSFYRIEWSDFTGEYDIWPGYRPPAGSPGHRRQLGSFIDKYHDDHYLYNEYLIKILTAQTFFPAYGKRVLMFDFFNNVNYRHHGDRSLLNKINDQIFIDWPNKSAMEWIEGRDEYKAPKGHLNEAGHCLVANRINEHIRNIGWFS